jgi:hypothetical protein
MVRVANAWMVVAFEQLFIQGQLQILDRTEDGLLQANYLVDAPLRVSVSGIRERAAKEINAM